MSTVVNSNDIEESLYKLFHKDKVRIEELLNLLKIRFYDKARNRYLKTFSIMDSNTLLICKYISIIKHIDRYLELSYDFIDPENSEYFYLFDQFDEGILSLLHSLLLVRLGYPNQAISLLRRTFETAIMGTFIGITFYKMKNTNFNPFLSLIESGLWISNITQHMRLKDVDFLIENMSEKDRISKNKTRIKIYENFTEIYLRNFCNGICNKWKNEKDTKNDYKLPYFKFKDDFSTTCQICNTATNLVLIQRPISIDLMINIINKKLGNNSFSLTKTYNNLSIYLHPNPSTNQHSQNYNLKLIREWSMLINDITKTVLWLFMRSLDLLKLLKDKYNDIYLILKKELFLKLNFS